MSGNKLRISLKIVGRKLDEEWVFLNLKNGVYYGLNETGSAMWDALKSAGDPEKALDRLQELYDMDRSRLKKDLTHLIRDLKKEGLLELASSS